MPMQWVEADENAHIRREDNEVEALYRSRFVRCGNFEDTPGLRTDSPAGDVDCHNLVCSWCACEKLKIRSADITNAYLQGKEVDRAILYRIPRGGILECDVPKGAVIAARVPINGTRDAGKGFWRQLKEIIVKRGFTMNFILPTFFVLRREGKIFAVMNTNVDDLLYGYHPEGKECNARIPKHFQVD